MMENFVFKLCQIAFVLEIALFGIGFLIGFGISQIPFGFFVDLSSGAHDLGVSIMGWAAGLFIFTLVFALLAIFGFR